MGHISVLLPEVIHAFEGKELKVFFEGTVGAGGHAKAILQAHPEIERFIGFDQDPQALSIAKETLAKWADKVELVHANFEEISKTLSKMKVKTVNGFFLTSEFHLCSSIKSKRDLVF